MSEQNDLHAAEKVKIALDSQQSIQQTKKQSSNSVLTPQQKQKLKQEGKQLLLKGCYRMASNKHIRLIDSGLKQFTPRQQAIIYLNCGICFQFMSEDNNNNYIKALQFMRSAILADNTYEKTYYRLIQLLRDHGHFQSALTVVPSTVKNKEIQELLKEVRQQYVSQSDFNKMLEKYKNDELSLENGKALCSKVSQTVHQILSRNVDFRVQIKKQPFKGEIQKVSNEISALYELIGAKSLSKSSDFKTQPIIALIQWFSKMIEPLFVSRIEDKNKILIIDLLLKSMMRIYRGQVAKFLQNKFIFNNKGLKLSQDSKFSSKNEFITITKRNQLCSGELNLIKYVRLIDVNLQLFGKMFCFLSNKSYEKVNILITGSKIPRQEELYGIEKLNKFVLSNMIDPFETISCGLEQENSRINYSPVYGGNLQYLYRNIKIVDLNYLKQILEEECSKVYTIYGKSFVQPKFLQELKQVLFSIDRLLDILLSLVQVYSYKQSRSMNTLVNQLSQVSELSHLIYIYHWEVHAYEKRGKLQQEKEPVQQQTVKLPSYQFNYKYEHLLNYFQKQNDSFITLYLIEKIIQLVQQGVPITNKKKNTGSKKEENTIKTDDSDNFNFHKDRTIEICAKKINYIESKTKQTKNNQEKKSESSLHYVYKQMYLILVCMMLKLDIKHKISIDSSLIFKEIHREIVSDMALQVLLLILINSPTQLTKYLQNPKDITNMVQNFMNKPLLEQLQPFRILLNIIYMLVCDFENDQELFFAKKLGVTQQEVHQVRKLQKQAMQQKQKEHLTKLKKKFKNFIALQWHEILTKMCKLLRVTLKMQAYCSSKLCKVVHTIAQANHSKLYSNQIIEFMLEARNIKDQSTSLQSNTKETACKFFQIICKKCNAQIFQYKHLQSIVDSLLWLISNYEHELVYFESLLGLINLSTMSVRIPIEEIQKCLYEENSYIMHAGVCVMNNILIYSEEMQEEDQKSSKVKNRISDLAYKYIEFYRDQIETLESQLPETDYSHPKKIYNSLMSLATVLKLQKLEELESWEHAVKYIKILSNNEASELLFKLAIYHSIEKSLPRNWHQGLQIQLQNLKRTEPQKYLKLAQLM